jgi:hypothetical protein
VFSVTAFTAVLGSGFQQWTFLGLWVHDLADTSNSVFQQSIFRVRDRFRVTFTTAVYRQLVRLGPKPLEDHDQRLLFFFATELLLSYFLCNVLSDERVSCFLYVSPLSSVRIAHIGQVDMVMGNVFSSQEAVSKIKVIIWNEEPFMGFEMCL